MTEPNYRSIVVGTDGSPLAEPTVARAARVASVTGAKLSVICAYSPVPRRLTAKNTRSAGGDERFDQVPGHEAGVHALQQAVNVAAAHDVAVANALLVDADAASALLHAATENQADLIVIGAIRDRSIAGRLLGNVATQVVGKAHCDVLIVRPAGWEGDQPRPEDA